MTDQRPTRDLSISETYGRDAARSVENIAAGLESLARRLREQKSFLENGTGKASNLAADIVNDYTHGVGANASRLYNLVTAAADADRHYVAEQSRAGREDA